MNLGFMLVIKCLSKLHPWPLVVYNFCVNTQLKKHNDKAQGYHNQAFQFHSNDLWENTIRKKKRWVLIHRAIIPWNIEKTSLVNSNLATSIDRSMATQH